MTDDFTVRTVRDRFLLTLDEMGQEYKILNPELLEINGQKMVFLIENPNLDDELEVKAIIKQSEIEQFGFVLIFFNPDNLDCLLIRELRQLINEGKFDRSVLVLQYEVENVPTDSD